MAKTTKTEMSTKNNTNFICKEIMNAQDVTAQRITELLVTELIAPGVTGKAEVTELSKKISSVVLQQSNALIDRVMKISS